MQATQVCVVVSMHAQSLKPLLSGALMSVISSPQFWWHTCPSGACTWHSLQCHQTHTTGSADKYSSENTLFYEEGCSRWRGVVCALGCMSYHTCMRVVNALEVRRSCACVCSHRVTSACICAREYLWAAGSLHYAFLDGAIMVLHAEHHATSKGVASEVCWSSWMMTTILC